MWFIFDDSARGLRGRTTHKNKLKGSATARAPLQLSNVSVEMDIFYANGVLYLLSVASCSQLVIAADLKKGFETHRPVKKASVLKEGIREIVGVLRSRGRYTSSI